MKLLPIFIILFTACSKQTDAPSEDYVLVEFASKLEEDSQKYSSKDDLKSSRRP